MPNKQLKNFKGLAQHIEFEELNPEYCHTLVNLDPDDPISALTRRKNYAKQYADAFTDIISAIEYKFPTSGSVILLFNDDGTLKYYTDGVLTGSLTLPTGATMEADFRNQYFGYQDHIIITTGNAATTYVLGFYYIKRVNASNTGLFGNAEQFTGYKLLKSQLITPNGTFSRVNNIVKQGDYYYVSFKSDSAGYSKWIEKRNANFQLVERFAAHPDASAGDRVSLAADTTYVYVAVEDTIYRINPTGWAVDESVTVPGGQISGIAVDDTNIYVVDATNTSAYPKTNFAGGAVFTQVASGRDVTADPIGASTHFWVLNGNTARRRSTSTGVVESSKTMDASASHIHYQLGGNVYVTEPGINQISELDSGNFAAAVIDTHSHINAPDELFDKVNSGDVYAISRTDGIVAEAEDVADIYTPDLITFNLAHNITGSLGAGTYFYKFSIVDTDGQEFTLSDPIINSHSSGSDSNDIHIVANQSQLNDLYRVQSINIYRAYSATQDAEVPTTNYKFLKTIDINDTGWSEDTTLSFYYYDFNDDVIEGNIDSVTFQENTGFSENTKPRYVNYKVHEWINRQLHCANMYVDGTVYKSKIAKSQVDSPDVVPFANTYDFDPYDGDEIKNITTAYSRAYVMKNQRTGIFYNDVPERIINWGLADTDAYLKDVYEDSDLIYMISNKGLVVIRGGTASKISDPVIDYFEGITSFTDATVFLRDDKERLLFCIPENRVLVWNRKYNTWTTYDDNYGFYGFFKNLANKYIAFGANPASGNHYFYLLDSGTDDDGTTTTVSYESPLLKLDDLDGYHSELTQLYYRQKSTGTYTLKIYDWRKNAKTLAKTITLTDLTTMSTIVAHLTDVWGEAFSYVLSGNGTVFQFASLTQWFELAGLAEEMA